jgi:hypothetical protein
MFVEDVVLGGVWWAGDRPWEWICSVCRSSNRERFFGSNPQRGIVEVRCGVCSNDLEIRIPPTVSFRVCA